jgi:hypothetical protein
MSGDSRTTGGPTQELELPARSASQHGQTARCWCRVVQAGAASSLLAVSLTGCASLYLHDAGIEKSTADAKSKIENLKLDALFDNDKAYLLALRKSESAAIAAEFAAERDAELIKFLRGVGPGGANGRKLMASRIDGYLISVAGKSDRSTAIKLWRVVEDAYRNPGDNELEVLQAGLDKTLPDLTSPASAQPLPSPSWAISLADALKAFAQTRAQLASEEKAAREAKDQVESALSTGTASLSEGTSAAARFDDQAKKAAALLAESNPYLRTYVSSALASRVQSLVDADRPQNGGSSEPLSAQATTGLAFVHAALGIGDAFSHPPRVPHPNALAATQAWLRYVESRADSDIAEGNAVLAVQRAEIAAVVAQVYYLSKAGEALQEVSDKQLKSTEGLADLTGASAASDRAIVAALVLYSAAWSQGFEPLQQLHEVEGPLVSRESKLRRSREAGAAWVSTLAPGVATLASYGAGGIDPQVLARLLQALGLGGIALGVNK